MCESAKLFIESRDTPSTNHATFSDFVKTITKYLKKKLFFPFDLYPLRHLKNPMNIVKCLHVILVHDYVANHMQFSFY